MSMQRGTVGALSALAICAAAGSSFAQVDLRDLRQRDDLTVTRLPHQFSGKLSAGAGHQ